MKKYAVKEMYYTLQGEGYHAGRPAVFCRFSGCNLWSGLEKDRPSAVCKFCDTDFWGTDGENGGKFTVQELGRRIDALYAGECSKFVVFTGGEPALQMDKALIEELHRLGFEIAVETNGTLPIPEKIDWVCVSPKADTDLMVLKGDELKLVYPQDENRPGDFEDLDFTHFFIQPKEDDQWEEHTKEAIEFVKIHPQWRLSVQSHKYLGIA